MIYMMILVHMCTVVYVGQLLSFVWRGFAIVYIVLLD